MYADRVGWQVGKSLGTQVGGHIEGTWVGSQVGWSLEATEDEGQKRA